MPRWAWDACVCGWVGCQPVDVSLSPEHAPHCCLLASWQCHNPRCSQGWAQSYLTLSANAVRRCARARAPLVPPILASQGSRTCPVHCPHPPSPRHHLHCRLPSSRRAWRPAAAPGWAASCSAAWSSASLRTSCWTS